MTPVREQIIQQVHSMQMTYGLLGDQSETYSVQASAFLNTLDELISECVTNDHFTEAAEILNNGTLSYDDLSSMSDNGFGIFVLVMAVREMRLPLTVQKGVTYSAWLKIRARVSKLVMHDG
jgi:hypothetical protein